MVTDGGRGDDRTAAQGQQPPGTSGTREPRTVGVPLLQVAGAVAGFVAMASAAPALVLFAPWTAAVAAAAAGAAAWRAGTWAPAALLATALVLRLSGGPVADGGLFPVALLVCHAMLTWPGLLPADGRVELRVLVGPAARTGVVGAFLLLAGSLGAAAAPAAAVVAPAATAAILVAVVLLLRRVRR